MAKSQIRGISPLDRLTPVKPAEPSNLNPLAELEGILGRSPASYQEFQEELKTRSRPELKAITETSSDRHLTANCERQDSMVEPVCVEEVDISLYGP